MRRFNKFSVLSVVGGSLLVLDSSLKETQEALAQTSSSTDQGEQTNTASRLVGVISLILDREPAQDDLYVTEQETALIVDAAQGVLSNDEADIGSMVAVLEDVQNGDLSLNADGSFEYLPNLNFVGVDSFRYTLTFGNGATSQARVTIRVNGMPDAVDDDFDLDLSNPFTGNVITNTVGGTDTLVDGAQVIAVAGGVTTLGGTLDLQANGDFSYTPPASLGTQEDSFTYTLQDAQGDHDSATITWRLVPLVLVPSPSPSVVEANTLDFTLPLFIPGMLDTLTLNSDQFDLMALEGASEMNPLSVTTFDFGDISVIGFDNQTGDVSIRYTLNNPLNHGSDSNDRLTESINVELVDTSRLSSANGTLSIDILDTSPQANSDTRALFEGSIPIAGDAFGDVNSQIGDQPDVIIDTTAIPVIDIDFGNTDGTPGTDLDGNFGLFNINQVGVYTYTLDNENPTVQALTTGESLTEVFTYTIQDADGDIASTDIIFTINGVDDAPPVIVVPDTNGSQFGDVSVTENATLNNGFFTFDLPSSLIENGFQITDGQGNVLSTDANDIQVNQTFTLANGTMTITGINQNIVQYNYEPTGFNRDHSAGDESVFDEITFSATNVESETASDTLTILITDTAPTAAGDFRQINENQQIPITGDVLTNDTSGSDTAISVSLIGFDDQNPAVGIPFETEFGTLDLNSDGTYTYTLDNDNPTVDALVDGGMLVEEIDYQIIDTDGDTSTTDLVIWINGVTD